MTTNDFSMPTSNAELAQSLPGNFQSHHVEVNGVVLHYVAGGEGEPLVLLPGWPQTWWQARKVMPLLARHFRVITVEIRGMGSSGTPAGGYDKKTMAEDVHELIRHLGYGSAFVAGHDIGSMVAFSLAANHPESVRRLALLEEPHPDESLYSFPLLPNSGERARHRWWFAFNQVAEVPEDLLEGRGRVLIDYLCRRNLRSATAIDEHAREIYAAAYSRRENIRAATGWYQAFPADIEDGAKYGRLEMPVAALYFAGHTDLPDALVTRAGDVTRYEIPGTGHYLAEEQPDAVAGHLIEFFGR
ncbi:alpha/beta fold hydrolase [Nocardia sp. NPDC059240]|uniref:alpha/beta fold hydrolase n=1 Tax=Nocardia sp. NPDC059240 TaxID=3346786 RepID=UPI003696E933